MEELVYYHGLIVQPDCHLCPLKGCKMVYPDGKCPSNFVLVGEGPGVAEDEANQFFVGATGKAQWYLTENSDDPFTREDCWVTNTVLCRKRAIRPPGGGPMLSADLVQRMAMAACRRRLIGELLSVTEGNPNAVGMAVGRHAMIALTGITGTIRDYRGSIIGKDKPLSLQKMWEEAHQL